MATDFKHAVREHYTSDEKVINLYTKLYQKMLEQKLLDSNFVSQMSDPEKTMHRLSELVILEHCTCCVTGIESKNKGPDLTFEFEGRRVNIEIITPIKVVLRKSKVPQCFFPPRAGQSSSRDVSIPEMSSLHERITGALKEKAGQYRKYLEKKTVSDDDVNIVCINLGFIEGREYIDYSYLRNLFTRQAAIHLEVGRDGEVSARIEDYDFLVTKKNSTVLKTSYFDNSEFGQIDGVWLISCNEKNLNAVSNRSHPNNSESNVMYHNYKSKIPPSLLFALKINSPQREEDFIAQIRVNKKLPEA
ncbi:MULTISPECIES: hypothetical protein [unclassified Pseudomonas]|uniref:hypothetical protein n=1 Tax=unclassified Pseudomonas TaxID=196821 RepID=UPI000C889CB8|nr:MULTISPECIES: hypothetical protein [unclassified Pseudomonas]PNA03626.1 hypothetical protein C1X28_19235 [Pseudomonas sp. FW305-BF15]PNB77454.1 hypothetical protein C1X30_28465 [Pseudomonas sp. FW305-BF6]